MNVPSGFLRMACLFAPIVFMFPVSMSAEETPSGKTVRLLTIGNSFSQNATQFLGDLAKSTGDSLVLRGANVGGASLELHWSKAMAFEADPMDKQGRYVTGKSLKEELEGGLWDVVTIQQASVKSHDVSTYRPFAKQLADYVRRHAPGTTLMIHQTWAYRVDSPRFRVTMPKEGEPRSQQEMYDGLSAAYREIASELGIRRIPVGDAFFRADTNPEWGYRVDSNFVIDGAVSPALPQQTHSLHVGWRWQKESSTRQKLVMDANHASIAGEYLGACVWYELLFAKPCAETTFVPKGLASDYARFLRETAHAAVEAAK